MQKATIGNIALFLNKTLRVRAVRDASKNGLQVRSRKSGAIRTVGFAVDACISTFELAKKQGAELIIVHHGIKWRPQRDKALELRREARLKKNNIALYAAHLPLDLHETYGNNMQLARMLGIARPYRFGGYHGIKIGYAGTFGTSQQVTDVASRLSKLLHTNCRVLPFGSNRVRSIGIVSGGGGSIASEVVQAGLDCFLVGEADLALYNVARDCGLNVIAAGHYATETVGVRALMQPVKEAFGVETIFIDDEKDL
jgi:dinuclear metal center YbgI/SA1388 family protein